MTDDAKRDWNQKVQARVDCLNILEHRGERYCASSCESIGEVNRELLAINKAGWKLHSIVPFVLPTRISLDHMTYFCIVAERSQP